MRPPNTTRPAPALAGSGPRKSDRLAGTIKQENKLSSVLAQHRSLPIASAGIVRWLISKNVSDAAMLSPWPLKEAAVKFVGPHAFKFDDGGEPALIFRATDYGETIDLVAWPAQIGRLASWRGAAFCLGNIDDALNPAVYFMDGALRVHRTPLDWLRAERHGIVIVEPRLTYSYLRNCQRLVVADVAHGRQIERWIQPPKPTCKILVEVQEERRAA